MGMKTALLLIDIQNEYFPGGQRVLEGPLEASAYASILLRYFRDQKWPTVHIQHVSTNAGASAFLPNSDGVKFHPSIAPLPGETVIVKHFPNSFRETTLLETLKNLQVERLVICGMMTHMCVDAGTRAAADLGFQVWLAADACATRELTFGDTKVPAEHVHAAFLAALKAYGEVLETREIKSKLAEA
jgi:nicotinamidase-related amidase